MLARFITLLIVIPLLDLILLIILIHYFGFWQTISFVIGIGIIGAIIAQRKGIDAITRAKKEIRKGNISSVQLSDGLFMILGSILFVIPGIITDALGIACLIPKSRQTMKNITIRYLKKLYKTLFHIARF